MSKYAQLFSLKYLSFFSFNLHVLYKERFKLQQKLWVGQNFYPLVKYLESPKADWKLVWISLWKWLIFKIIKTSPEPGDKLQMVFRTIMRTDQLVSSYMDWGQMHWLPFDLKLKKNFDMSGLWHFFPNFDITMYNW